MRTAFIRLGVWIFLAAFVISIVGVAIVITK
jgi:hypothetical protein